MRFYTGSYTRMGGPGVGVCRWENGQLSMVNAYHDLNDTTFVILSHDQRTLYAVGSLPETGESAAASYRVAGDSLELLSCRAAAGKAACHQAESADGHFLYVANYLTGSVSVFPVDDGVLGERIQLVEHTGCGPNTARQECAHTHQCTFRPGTNELFVCDLGIDKVMVYDQNTETGLLSLKEEIAMPGGMGPRHLVFADADHFYVTGELDNVVRYVVNDKGWKIIGEMSTLPAEWKGENTSAAIRLHDVPLKLPFSDANSLFFPFFLDIAFEIRYTRVPNVVPHREANTHVRFLPRGLPASGECGMMRAWRCLISPHFPCTWLPWRELLTPSSARFARRRERM